MQITPIVLAMFNDMIGTITLTSNGSPINLAAVTEIDMYLKVAKGTPDSQALLLSSTNGGIVITNASSGICQVTIPRADLQEELYTFYRVDVLASNIRSTCIYGQVSYVVL